jgi:hypothetical protein
MEVALTVRRLLLRFNFVIEVSSCRFSISLISLSPRFSTVSPAAVMDRKVLSTSHASSAMPPLHLVDGRWNGREGRREREREGGRERGRQGETDAGFLTRPSPLGIAGASVALESGSKPERWWCGVRGFRFSSRAEPEKEGDGTHEIMRGRRVISHGISSGSGLSTPGIWS